MELKIEYLPIEELKPYANNAKEHPAEQIEQIKKSIEEFGFSDPIGIWKDEIVEGHGRLIAALELGMDTVPVIRLDHLTDEQRRAYALVHNKLTMNSDFNLDLLRIELDDIDIDMTDFGFDLDEEDDEPIEVQEDDVPEKAESRCKLGDLWQLGSHRLICGDSTDVAVIDRLMDGVKADMVFTDPPYGMLKENKGVKNDSLDSIHMRNKKNLLEFNKKWIPISVSALKNNGSWYCWGIDEPLMDIYCFVIKPYIEQVKLTFRNLITWDKGLAQGQKSKLFRQYPVGSEKCLFCQCGFQEGFSNNGDDFDMRFEHIRRYIENECVKSGINEAKTFNSVLSATNKYQHLVTKSHWYLMKEKDYLRLREYAKSQGIDAFSRPYRELENEYNESWAYFNNTHDNMNDVWHFNRTSESEREHTGGHATPKPIALCSRAIKSSSREGEIVLDVFGGSGSTLIACEQLNRKCYMAELDPKYCDVIIQRWEDFTGRKAVKILRED